MKILTANPEISPEDYTYDYYELEDPEEFSRVLKLPNKKVGTYRGSTILSYSDKRDGVTFYVAYYNSKVAFMSSVYDVRLIGDIAPSFKHCSYVVQRNVKLLPEFSSQLKGISKALIKSLVTKNVAMIPDRTQTVGGSELWKSILRTENFDCMPFTVSLNPTSVDAFRVEEFQPVVKSSDYKEDWWGRSVLQRTKLFAVKRPS